MKAQNWQKLFWTIRESAITSHAIPHTHTITPHAIMRCELSFANKTRVDSELCGDLTGAVTVRPRRLSSPIKDHSHSGYGLFTLLPSGRHYRSIRARTTRLTNSFYPQAVESATLNSRHHLVLHTHTNTLATYIYMHIFLFNLIFPTLETALLVFQTVVTYYML